jgi:hypothetical protein
MLGQTFCPRGTDIIRIHNFQHVRSRKAHEAADAEKDENDGRQDHMPCLIQENLEVRIRSEYLRCGG